MSAIGIDLGTTFSCVSVLMNNSAEVIANEIGNRTTPSIVGFRGSDVLVGEAALEEIDAENTIYDAKRLIGRKSDDQNVIDDAKRWPFKVVQNEDKPPKIRVQHNGRQQEYLAEEISAFVLKKMKEVADNFTGEEAKNAVITVPAYFNNAQRQATVEAGKTAGLNVLRIVNEPTAAAIAYSFKKGLTNAEGKKILVYDLGGGTFDVSILKIEKDDINVLAVTGDDHLGGADFDARLFDHFATEVKEKLGKDVRKSPRAMARLRAACERAKRSVTGKTMATIGIEALINGKDFKSEITRAKFEMLCHDLFKRTRTLVLKALEDASLNRGDIDEVLLVGGSTRIPKIVEIVSETFPGIRISKDINPDEAVAQGAAILAGKLSGVTVDAKIRRMDIRDVTSMSLGTNVTDEHHFSVIIPRNTRIPTSCTETYVNSRDFQTAMSAHIYQGDAPLCKDNHFVGGCELMIDNPKPCGQNSMEITLRIDENGILHVTAKDPDSMRVVTARIEDMKIF